MKQTLVVLLFLMAAIGLFAEVLISESFDSPTFPPTGWSNLQVSGTGLWQQATTGVDPDCTPHTGAGMAFYNSYTYSAGVNANLITPSFNAATGFIYSVSFWMYRSDGYPTNPDRIDVYTNSALNLTGASLVGTVHLSNTLSPTPAEVGWSQYTFDFTPVSSAGNSYIILNGYSAWGDNIFMDDVVVSRIVAPANDIAASQLTGSVSPTAGTASDYTVTVVNIGTSTQSNYSVKLMSGETELASVAGPELDGGEIANVVLSWTPTTAGTTQIFGKVVLAGDMNPANDQTDPMTVDVQAAGTILVVLGDGTATQRQPFAIYFGYERDATLYTQDQVNQFGPILGLKWYCGTGAAAAAPYKIWMNTTTSTSLTATPWDTFVAGATLAKEGTQAFPNPGWYSFTFDTPFMYSSGNLVVMVETTYTGTGVSPYPYFTYTTNTAADQHLVWYADNNPPTDGGSLNANKPNIGILFSGAGLAHLTGTVTSNATPLEGVTVSIGATTQTTVTNASGQYDFPFVIPGTYTVTASKIGYSTSTQNVTLTADQTTTLNFNLSSLPVVNVTGLVTGSATPTVGLEGANVTLVGDITYTATTDATGHFTIAGVLSSTTYTYTITMTGFTPNTGTIDVGTTDFDMGTKILNELSLPPTGVTATANGQTSVNVTWTEPGTGGGEYLHYDSGENNDSIGVNGPADFDIAIRFAPADLANFAGMSLYTVKFWPAVDIPACQYSIRVWTGGTSTVPGTMVVDQNVPAITLSAWNEVTLDTPVTVTGNEELWFGVRCNTTMGFPAGCDAGPAHDGQGNMMFFGGEWTTLLALAPTLNFDWNVEGFVGFAPPTGAAPSLRSAPLHALNFNADRFNTGTLRTSGKQHFNKVTTTSNTRDGQRPLVGYKVWRLLAGQEANEAAWTVLTPNPITATAYTDGGWATVADGTYRWAVKADYTNDVLSPAAFSNPLQKLTQVGTIAGIVRNSENAPINGATVTAGTYTATSNASGAFSVTVPSGLYSVTASATGYESHTTNNVVVTTGQTTIVNFALDVATTIEDGFETYADFTLDFAPWVNNDVDGSDTYSYNGYTWTNAQAAQSFIVFNPSATTPSSVDVIGPTHSGNKMAACWADTAPPNNDWLISQTFSGGGSISFWARAMSADYPDETFTVGVSSGGTAPNNFTTISGAAPVVTTGGTTWTLYSYDLAAHTGTIRVGIHCISPDQFCFQIDDVVMNIVANDDPIVPVVATALNGAYPNPFNPETTISYSVKDAGPVVVEIFNAKGQKVKTLVNETKASGTYNVKWNGTDQNNHKLGNGVYFYKMNAGKFTSSKKMILMK